MSPENQGSYNTTDDHGDDTGISYAGNPVVIEREKPRNLIAFWILGLCNNYSYVIMLSAAFDIMAEQKGDKKQLKYLPGFHCNLQSTGVILLADILPALFVKLIAPFFMQCIGYHVRVSVVVLTAILSFLFVAFSTSMWVSMLGVILASFSSGFGEITFLSLTSHFRKAVVTCWSSGTGGAGVAGALAYAGLRTFLSPRNTLLSMLIVPAAMCVTFLWLLELPSEHRLWCCRSGEYRELVTAGGAINTGNAEVQTYTFKEKLFLIRPLLKYIVPLFLVYAAEYTINQGLYELLYFKVSWLDQAAQYRWFQVDYQVGVLISRSSASLYHLKRIEIPTAIQFVILLLMLLEVIYAYMHTIWLALALIFIEGLCGGAVYVNAFYAISTKITPEHREFSMGAASIGDSLGITFSSLVSISIHNSLCRMKLG